MILLSMTPTMPLLFHLCIISSIPSRTMIVSAMHEEMHEWTREDEKEWEKAEQLRTIDEKDNDTHDQEDEREDFKRIRHMIGESVN